eukprot:170434-Amphidinium_carterae.1
MALSGSPCWSPRTLVMRLRSWFGICMKPVVSVDSHDLEHWESESLHSDKAACIRGLPIPGFLLPGITSETYPQAWPRVTFDT